MRKFFTLLFHVNTYNQVSKSIEFGTVSSTENVIYKAPDHCVENILNFARAYRVANSENTGKIEMILN